MAQDNFKASNIKVVDISTGDEPSKLALKPKSPHALPYKYFGIDQMEECNLYDALARYCHKRGGNQYLTERMYVHIQEVTARLYNDIRDNFNLM